MCPAAPTDARMRVVGAVIDVDVSPMTRPQWGWAAKLVPAPHRLPLTGWILVRTTLQNAAVGLDAVALVYAIVSPGGVASSGHRPLIALAMLAGSFIMWAVMVRTGRRLLGLRLVTGLGCTMVLASLADSGHPAMGAVGIAAIVEIAMLRGPWALPVPLLWFAAAAIGGLGEPMAAMALIITLDWCFGWGIAIYMMLRERATERAFAILAGARGDEAHLAARTEVLHRSGDTADLVQRAGVLLALHGSDVGAVLGEKKREITDEAHARGGLLGTEIARWLAEINRSPDLGEQTSVDVPPDLGSMLLTSDQVAAVRTQLHVLPARGHLIVRPGSGAPHRTDRERSIVVDHHEIRIPPAPGLRRWVQSPVPTACVVVVLWTLHPLAAGLSDLPAVPFVFFAIGLVLAGWTYREVERHPAGVSRVVVAMYLYTAVFAIASAPSAVVLDQSAVRMAPAEGATEIATLLLALARPYLPPRWHRWLPLAVVGLVGCNALSLLGSTWRNVAAESLFVPAMWLIARGWGDHLKRTDALEARRRAADLERHLMASMRAGRRDVVDLLRGSLDQLRVDRARHRDALRRDPDLAAEVDRRIVLAERSLAQLERTCREQDPHAEHDETMAGAARGGG